MCGIVGVAGTGPASVQMKEFFAQLLLHDVIRGHHATGVAAIDTLNRDLCVEKKAIASPEFLQDKEIMDNLFAHKHNFNIYVGHNRWATSGAKDDDDNAHPFIHGDIVGVHNGSLRNQRLLDDHAKFAVDSDNLFYHLNKNGLDETLKKVNGAFALVWYDKTDNSLNFLRNEERPLAIGKLSNGYWVWASEIGMLRWLIKRHKNLAFESRTEKKEDGSELKWDVLFNLTKGTHMKIAFKDKTRQYDGEPITVEKELTTFPAEVYSGNYYGGGRSRSTWDNSHGDTRPARSRETERYNESCQSHLDKFIIDGKMSSSVLEVEFQQIVKEKTPTGFEATIALFNFNNKDGQVVKCHCFVHDGVKFLKEWDETKKGTKVYGTICTVTSTSLATYDCTKNPEPLGFAMSLNMVRLEKPAKYYPFGEAPGPKSKGGVDAGNNVVPFRGSRTLRPDHQASEKEAGSTGSKGSSTPEVEGVDASFMGRQISLANGQITQKKYLEILQENGPMCSNCGTKITMMPTGRLYRTIWYDRDTTLTQNYLSCCKRCFNLTEAVMDQLDEDYDKRFGGRDD